VVSMVVFRFVMVIPISPHILVHVAYFVGGLFDQFDLIQSKPYDTMYKVR